MSSFVPFPSSVPLAFASARCVGFSGSRSAVLPPGLWSAVASLVPASSVVAVGCARGLDASVRASFPASLVFVASAFGRGRGSFAARSVSLVRFVAASSSSLWVSFPSSACPVGLLPSSRSARCFAGFGSGSWASLAFAVGCGVRCLVWLPAGVSVPASWGFVSVGGGWWFRS
jgi:hypothetical protein